MFTKEQKHKEGIGGITSGSGAKDEQETVIGPSVKVEGDFASDGNVLVYGIVVGSLKTSGVLKVESGAKIKANIEAQSAMVAGEIKGNVVAHDGLEIRSSACLEGDIITKVLSIEPGATLKGHCLVAAEPADKDKKDAEPSLIQKPAIEK